jgi:hypothetical protein
MCAASPAGGAVADAAAPTPPPDAATATPPPHAASPTPPPDAAARLPREPAMLRRVEEDFVEESAGREGHDDGAVVRVGEDGYGRGGEVEGGGRGGGGGEEEGGGRGVIDVEGESYGNGAAAGGWRWSRRDGIEGAAIEFRTAGDAGEADHGVVCVVVEEEIEEDGKREVDPSQPERAPNQHQRGVEDEIEEDGQREVDDALMTGAQEEQQKERGDRCTLLPLRMEGGAWGQSRGEKEVGHELADGADCAGGRV